MILVGVVRVALTYSVFCETFDEPAHVAAGMEWLDRGTYVSDLEHPPLARVAIAIGPFLAGIRSVNSGSFVIDGNAVLYAGDRYLRNLSLARAGVLPFFIIATLFVAAWARSAGGDAAGIAAALLFSNEPNLLAHAGLATTDMAAAAGTIAAAYIFHKWLVDGAGEGRRRFDVIFGAVTGLALLAKFSTWLFLPVIFLVLLIAQRRIPRHFVRTAVVSSLVALSVLWAGYRFSIGKIETLGGQHEASRMGPSFTIPAPELAGGVITVRNHAARGHGSYLFGQFSDRGWWYYFPVSIALKTTIGFLALLCVALLMAGTRRALLPPIAAGLSVVAVSMPVSINIGVRHVLPAYPFFAIAAGVALVALYRRQRGAAVVLLALSVVPSVAAHPDYLPYFNALAPKPHDRVLVDSNLDWGQDLLRLQREVARRGIDRISLAYAGNAEPDLHGMRRMPRLDPWRYTPGWAAISEVLVHSRDGQYGWLDLFKPVARVGKSIRLYYLPPLRDLASGQVRQDDVTGILIPVWFEGTFTGTSSWLCELVISNSSPAPVVLRSAPDGESLVVVPPMSSVVNPALRLSNALNGAMLYVSDGAASQVHFALSLRGPGGQTIAIPVVREDEAASATLRFPSVATGGQSRATLRIYDLSGQATEAVVRLNDRTSANVTLTRRDAADAGLTLAVRTLDSIFAEIPTPRAAISVDVKSSASWAFLTVSDGSGTYIVLPD